MRSPDDLAKARVRLWLRSERALGLRSVAVDRSILTLAPTEAAPASPSRTAGAPVSPQMARRPASAPRPAPVAPGRPAAGASTAPQSAHRPDPARRPVLSTMFPTPDAGAGLVPPPSREPFTAPVLATDEKAARLAAMNDKEVRGCTRCRLCETRTQTVFGEGDPDARIFFIGEGPGENEDQTGRPFVGRAGQLLEKMINAMGLKREQVFIANIVKCRPPNNRVPAPDEVSTCTPYLERQLEIIRPRVIVTLGLPSAKYMLNTKLSMGKLRGQWQEWRGIKLMPTFHPAYVLRVYTDEVRAAVWSDLQKVMDEVGLRAPRKKSGSM